MTDTEQLQFILGAFYRYIEKELWPLLDACGPEREVGFGNPKSPGDK